MGIIVVTLVSGESNFSMKRTSLTVGGFNQPSVARCLIELPGNAEKGLSQCFLWLFPKPVYSECDTLEPTDRIFTDKIGIQSCDGLASLHIHQFIVTCLAGLWTKASRNRIETKVFRLPVQDDTTCIYSSKNMIKSKSNCNVLQQWMILCQVCMHASV